MPRLVALLLLLLSGTAFADDARAKKLYFDGEAAFQAGRFAEAAAAFEESYALSRRPKLLWNIAQAHRRNWDVARNLESLRRARAVFRNYSTIAETESERRDSAAAEREVSALIEAAERGAMEREAQERAAKEREDRAAREREAQERAAREREMRALSPEPLAPSVGVPPTPAQPAASTAPSPEARRGSIVPGIALLGVGAGALALGLTFGLLARAAAFTVEEAARRTPPEPFEKYAHVESRGRTLELVSYVLYGVGAAAAVTGAVLVAVRPGGGRRTAWIAPAPGGLLVGGAW